MVSVDSFIDDATLYAQGLVNQVEHADNNRALVEGKPKSPARRIRRFSACTFTLDKAAREGIAKLADELGFNKSQLIREMTRYLQANHTRQLELLLTTSNASKNLNSG
ncbi:hypothetical protein C2869_14255 [Saccharobesus litoralis]|uniref:Ribbon-helix-helix protein, copG family n=1 Tax=Saccharobesus litoralis TaxID=2172099 RepID=A0A2S0VTW2_9ALTE|nr:hypothetical protein C2869_14255 [Saccharobesus litoralis]